MTLRDFLHDVTYIALDSSSTSIETGSLFDDVRNMQIIDVSGSVLATDWYLNARHFETVAKGRKVSDIIDAQGEWSALAGSNIDGKNHFVYFGDPSGFSPLFYSIVPGRAVVVSDSFSGVVHGVRKLGGTLTLNLPNYVTILSGKTATFQNLISHDTMATEVRILGHDEALYVGPQRATVISRNDLSGTAKINDYLTALNKGIETASASIRTLYAGSQDCTPIITLTGGVDSRAVLALISVTGLASKFTVWSMDPRHAKRLQQKKVLTADVEIARELKLKYGLQWMSPRRRSKMSLSFEEGLAHYQSYNSNYSFGFAPANHVTVDEQPILTLRGGGGEVLRGTGGARIASARYTEYCKEHGNTSQADWAAKHYLRDSLLTDTTRDLAQKNLSQSLSNYVNGSMRQCLDAYYQRTRNRGHFGHLRQSDAVNDKLLQVLTNPFLIRAAELAEYQSKIEGKVIADLFDLIDPSLRTIPFETETANQQFLRGKSSDFNYKDRDRWQREFDQVSKSAQRINFLPFLGPGERNEKWEFQANASSIAFIEGALDNILGSLTGKDRDIVEPLHRLLLQHVHEGSVPVGSLVSKLASALEVYRPMPLSISGTHLYCDPARSDRVPPASLLSSAARIF